LQSPRGLLQTALHMARVATTLTPTKSGGFTARKRIPEDVQAAYEPLYGVRWEERLRLPPIPIHLARAKHRDWLTEIESRVVNLRAVRAGAGRSLAPKDARALAGEWYHWFTERHIEDARTAAHWEDLRDKINDALTDHLDPWRDPNDRDRQELDDVWQHTLEAREVVRAMHADWCETSQFLAVRRMVLDAPSRDLFLDHLYGDFGEALRLLIKRAGGDYTADAHPLQFPKFDDARDAGQGPWQLFELWAEAKKPARATIDRWRGVFLQLQTEFTGRSAGSITPDDAQEWADKLGNAERSASTVHDVWVGAARSVFAWAVAHKHTPRNPFKTVHVTVPRKTLSRAGKSFHADEVKTILSAALAIKDTGRPSAATRRWAPWLCAYTGARVGEITQLRGVDVIEQEGVNVIRITPDAGTVKTGMGRTVPLHEHLIAQGFLTFAASRGAGPLFYNVAKGPLRVRAATKPGKAQYVRTREHVAKWVRGLGVNDPEVRPNHAWRHTFKQVAAHNGIPDGMSDYITGHAPATVARGYGAPTIGHMAEALKKFPRYAV
jgi:integrase